MDENQITRNKLQEYCFQLMYSFLELQKSNTPIDFVSSLEGVLEMNYEDIDVFLKLVLIKALKNENKIIEYISKYLKNWEFSRLNDAIQAILIVAVTEYYLKDEEIEKAVIINNSVKLAKRYGDGGDKDYKFVNAILDNCLDERRENLLLD